MSTSAPLWAQSWLVYYAKLHYCSSPCSRQSKAIINEQFLDSLPNKWLRTSQLHRAYLDNYWMQLIQPQTYLSPTHNFNARESIKKAYGWAKVISLITQRSQAQGLRQTVLHLHDSLSRDFFWERFCVPFRLSVVQFGTWRRRGTNTL